MTDEELVRNCSKGNGHAQKALYDQFAGRMFGVCLRYTSNREEAEDILQEGFVKVFQAIAMFKGFGPLENWIKKIIVNTALDHYRQQKSRIQETELFENCGEPVEPLQELHAQELLKIIHQLPSGYRTVFNLYAIEGYNHREIGKMLNISEGTSKSQYARARTNLVRMLNHKETPSANIDSRMENLVIIPIV